MNDTKQQTTRDTLEADYARLRDALVELWAWTQADRGRGTPEFFGAVRPIRKLAYDQVEAALVASPAPTPIPSAVVTELEQLGKWVRDMQYNRDDAPDEIARAIENRVRQLRRPSLPDCIFPMDEQPPREITENGHRYVLASKSNTEDVAVERDRSAEPGALSQALDAVAWAYQFAAARGATIQELDNLSAVAQRQPPPHEWSVVSPEPEALSPSERERVIKILEPFESAISEAADMYEQMIARERHCDWTPLTVLENRYPKAVENAATTLAALRNPEPQREQPEDSPYFIEVDAAGCPHCKGKRTWRIVGPDDMALSTSWEDEEFASDLADELNAAYCTGRGQLKVVLGQQRELRSQLATETAAREKADICLRRALQRIDGLRAELAREKERADENYASFIRMEHSLTTLKPEAARVLEPFKRWFDVMNAILERDRQRGITRKGGWENNDEVLGGLGQIVTRGDFRFAAEFHARLTTKETPQ